MNRILDPLKQRRYIIMYIVDHKCWQTEDGVVSGQKNLRFWLLINRLNITNTLSNQKLLRFFDAYVTPRRKFPVHSRINSARVIPAINWASMSAPVRHDIRHGPHGDQTRVLISRLYAGHATCMLAGMLGAGDWLLAWWITNADIGSRWMIVQGRF